MSDFITIGTVPQNSTTVLKQDEYVTTNVYTTTIPYTTTWASTSTNPYEVCSYTFKVEDNRDMKNFEKVEKVVKKKEKLDPRLVKVNKEIEELRKKTSFSWIKEYVPNKVYGFKFGINDKEFKTICADEDVFNLAFAFALAYAKGEQWIHGNTLTPQGVIKKANNYFDYKKETKEIKNGIKLFYKLQEKEVIEEQIKAEKKHRHDKLVAKKIAAKERKKNEQYEIIRAAIEDSKS